jgi:hypothetical protein
MVFHPANNVQITGKGYVAKTTKLIEIVEIPSLSALGSNGTSGKMNSTKRDSEEKITF